MSTQTQGWDQVAETLEALRREVGDLARRVAALETVKPAAPAVATVSPPAPHRIGPPPSPPAIAEETILVIGAALAAFFGKRPHIRQIRLLGSAAWAQEGRITIQASHARVQKG